MADPFFLFCYHFAAIRLKIATKDAPTYLAGSFLIDIAHQVPVSAHSDLGAAMSHLNLNVLAVLALIDKQAGTGMA